MTKVMIAVGVLSLIEQGRLLLFSQLTTTPLSRKRNSQFNIGTIFHPLAMAGLYSRTLTSGTGHHFGVAGRSGSCLFRSAASISRSEKVTLGFTRKSL
jgi:hypothetical protein